MNNVFFDTNKAKFYIALSCYTSNIDYVKYILKSYEGSTLFTKSTKFGKISYIEIYTPIMNYSTLEDFYNTLSLLEKCCKINEESYLHIYCLTQNFTFKNCVSLCNLQVPKSDLIANSLKINLDVEKKLDKSFVRSIQNVTSMEEFKNKWYEYSNGKATKHVIDFHEFFHGLGIAFKYYNATFDKDTIQAYIDFSNAMILASQEKKYTIANMPSKEDSTQWDFMSSFLWKIGIVGKRKEFQITRHILLDHLEGSNEKWNNRKMRQARERANEN